MLHDGRHVDDLPECRPPLRLLGEELEQPEVLEDVLLCARPLDLHHDPRAVGERGLVHLGDRAGGHRLGLDVLEHVLPRHPELLLHDLHDFLLGERRHLVLERGELLDELRRQEVGPCREDLAELGERGPELLHGLAEAPGLGADAFLALVAPGEQVLHAVLGHHRADPRGPAHQLGFPGLHGRIHPDGARADVEPAGPHLARAVGRVDDDHGAPGVVGDPVGDVAEQELPAAGHPGVPHDEDVGVCVFGRADDGHGRVRIDHHVRVAPGAGKLGRDLLQLLGGEARPGRLGLAGLGAGRVVGQEDLHDVELGGVPVGHLGRPVDGPGRRLRAIGGHDDALDRIPSRVMRRPKGYWPQAGGW